MTRTHKIGLLIAYIMRQLKVDREYAINYLVRRPNEELDFLIRLRAEANLVLANKIRATKLRRKKLRQL